jgi:hypothetical protein
MMAIMRLVSIMRPRLKGSGLGYRVGIGLLVLGIVTAIPDAAFSWQPLLRLTQDTPPNQQERTSNQAPGQAQNPADQPSPDGEQGQI